MTILGVSLVLCCLVTAVVPALLGVTGFYPLFGITAKKSAGTHATEFTGTTENRRMGVDGSAILHKVFNTLDLALLREVSVALHMSDELPNGLYDAIEEMFAAHVDFFRKTLKVSDIVFVFDGLVLPGKLEEKNERLEKCRKSFDEAFSTSKDDQHKKRLSESLFRTFSMTQAAMATCKGLGCSAWQAVYEADSQLGKMCRDGDIDFVMCEDADIIIHGAKYVFVGMLQPTAHFKAGKRSSRFPGCWVDPSRDLSRLHIKKQVNKKTETQQQGVEWDRDDLLLLSCCLGTDYGSVVNIGPSTVADIVETVRKLKQQQPHYSYVEWLQFVRTALEACPRVKDADTAFAAVRKSALSFRTQWVFNVRQQGDVPPFTLQRIDWWPAEDEDASFAGPPPVSTELLPQYAAGEIDPVTKVLKPLQITKSVRGKPEWTSCRLNYSPLQMRQELPIILDTVITTLPPKAVRRGADRALYRTMPLRLGFFVDKKACQCVIECTVPASFSTQHMYSTLVHLQLSPDLKFVLGKLDAYCICQGGSLGDCTHVAAALYTMQDIVYAADRVPGEKSRIVSRTELLCKWGVPTGNVDPKDLEKDIEHFYPPPSVKIAAKKEKSKKNAKESKDKEMSPENTEESNDHETSPKSSKDSKDLRSLAEIEGRINTSFIGIDIDEDSILTKLRELKAINRAAQLKKRAKKAKTPEKQ